MRETYQSLLEHRYVEAARKPEIYRRAVAYRESIAAVLEPLDLELRLDEFRGLAFLAVAVGEGDAQPEDGDDPWKHSLVRRQRMTLQQSLVVAFLRKGFLAHEQEAGVGHSAARVAVDDLLQTFLTYFGESGSDTKDENRLQTVLDQLKEYGLVSIVDSNGELTVRPLIAHLANPESLAALLKVMRERSQPTPPPEEAR